MNNNGGNCRTPLVEIGGVCRCPKNGIHLAGKCFASDRYSKKTCQSPSSLINGECICPDGQIYSEERICESVSQNIHASEGPSFLSNFGFGSSLRSQSSYTQDKKCSLPRIIVGGYCKCPNNGVFLSGKCYERDTGIYPTEPITDIPNMNSIEGLSKIFRSYDGTENNQYH